MCDFEGVIPRTNHDPVLLMNGVREQIGNGSDGADGKSIG